MISSCTEKYGLFLINQQGTNSSGTEVSLNSLLIQSCNKLFSIHCCVLIVCEQKCILFLCFRNIHHKYCHSISFAHNTEFYTLQEQTGSNFKPVATAMKMTRLLPSAKALYIFLFRSHFIKHLTSLF